MPLPKFAAWLIDSIRGRRESEQPPVFAPPETPKRAKTKAEKKPAPRDLIVAGRVPEDYEASRVDLSEESQRFALPPRLRCFELNLARTAVETLPAGLQVGNRIDLTGCASLTSLPEGLKTGTLILQDCTALEALPENLSVHFLVLDGCRALKRWPESARVTLGRVSARNCAALTSIPASLGPVTSLDLTGCAAISALPQGVQVSSWLDLQGTGVRSLPESLRGVRLRWRGVTVSERVVFAPQTIPAAEILAEPNAEVRRVMLDQCGLDRFLAEAHATIRDEDRDAGGVRQLLVVEMPGDEPLVCVLVHCPSTARRYLIRVPPATRTCHEAVAWTAGFDNPAEYAPVQET
ncbi:MAG: hypothetical protein V4773_04775 [Verrucomicrobiota bacterium]